MNPSAASGSRNTLTMQFISERVYGARSALRSGGLGERTVIPQGTRTPSRSIVVEAVLGQGAVRPAGLALGRGVAEGLPPAPVRRRWPSGWPRRSWRRARAEGDPVLPAGFGVGVDLEEVDRLVAEQDDDDGRRGRTEHPGQR